MINSKILGLAVLGTAGYIGYRSGAFGGQQDEEVSFGAGGVSGFNFGQAQRNFRGAPSPSEASSKKTTKSGEPYNIVIRESNDWSGITDQINQQRLTKKQQELDKYSNLSSSEQEGFISGALSSSDIQQISSQKTASKKSQAISEATNLSGLGGVSSAEFTKKYGKTKSEVRQEAGIPEPTISEAPETTFFSRLGANIKRAVTQPSSIGDWLRRI